MNFAPSEGLEGHERKLAPGSPNPPRGNLGVVEESKIEVITSG
jgi:hypothetical protein